MSTNIIRPILFSIVMIVYLWYPYSMIRGQEEILEKGTTYRFQPRPVDPVDAFRGRYVVLGYDGLNFNYPEASTTFNYNQKVFVSLTKNDQGFAIFNELHTAPPSNNDYLATTCTRIDDDKVWVATPTNMERYFLNEDIAPAAERYYNLLSRQNQSADTVHVYVDTKVKDGVILLEQLYMKDQPVEAFIRAQDQ